VGVGAVDREAASIVGGRVDGGRSGVLGQDVGDLGEQAAAFAEFDDSVGVAAHGPLGKRVAGCPDGYAGIGS
jgi:hypothetical protein